MLKYFKIVESSKKDFDLKMKAPKARMLQPPNHPW